MYTETIYHNLQTNTCIHVWYSAFNLDVKPELWPTTYNYQTGQKLHLTER